MVSFTRRPLYLWGKNPLRIEQEDQWDAESFSTPLVVQPVAQSVEYNTLPTLIWKTERVLSRHFPVGLSKTRGELRMASLQSHI